jgi:PilZ domain
VEIKRLPTSLIPGFMDQSGGVQNRRSNRSPVLLSAKIEHNGTADHVRLRNLSRQGALIEAHMLPPEGSNVVFERNGLRVRGRVVWSESGFAGVAFERPIAMEDVLRHVPKPRQTFEQKYRRPGLACEPLSEADRRMLQIWATSSSSLGD